MFKKVTRALIILIGFAIGPALMAVVYPVLSGLGGVDLYNELLPWANLIIFILSGVLTGIIFFLLSSRLADALYRLIKSIEANILKVPSSVIVTGVFGLIVGLLISFLITGLLNTIPVPSLRIILSVIVYMVFAYLGISIALKRKRDFNLLHLFKRTSREKLYEKGARDKGYTPKILDTSVIIDGRIFDICKTGIIEGIVIIPEFILEELRHIADSSDDLKRARGRRGLDVLNKIQKELDIPVKISKTDFEDAVEVDSKLIRLAQELKGVVVTNDYNLNKVAALQDIDVFNINELANAVKPVVLPGEEMTVQVIKDGKESGQGIAYLDDGTMIVVDGGKGRQGEVLNVVVTSVLQTAAGRMIFAKIKGEKKAV